MTYISGKRRIKLVEEQYADFMRLVEEFDVDEQIPANLPNIPSTMLSMTCSRNCSISSVNWPTGVHCDMAGRCSLAAVQSRQWRAVTLIIDYYSTLWNHDKVQS